MPEMSKKIGFLIMNMDGDGGTERVTSVIANELTHRHFDVTVFSCQYGNHCKFSVDDRVKLISLNGEICGNSIQRKFLVEKKLLKYVKDSHIDVMIAVDVALYLYLIPLQIAKLCKCIAWEHFNYYISPNKMVKNARKFAAEHADCVVVLGKNDLNNYLTNYKHAKNITYIYNPITVNTKESSTLERKRAIAVGRLSTQKGFDMLIEAWSLIEKEVQDWELDIYGQGVLKDELQAKIKEMKLKNINLRGFSDDIHREYMNSSLFFLSSRFEGFGLVLVEALATGLPIVSFNCKEGPEEIIDDGVNGYLIENGNIRQFANSAIKIMKNNELLRNFASKTKKDLERFNIESIATQWEELLNNV